MQAGTDDVPAIVAVKLVQSPVALQTTWTYSAPLFSGALSLNTAGLVADMVKHGSLDLVFSVQVTPSGAQPFTVYQSPVTILSELVIGAPSVPSPSVSYYTSAQSDARYQQIDAPVLGVITPFATSIADAQAADSSAVGVGNIVYILNSINSGALAAYQLVSGTPSQGSPFQFRPDDNDTLFYSVIS